MAHKLPALTGETTTTTGTGAYTLGGALVVGSTTFFTFSAGLSDGDTTLYSCYDGNGNKETGYGTYSSTGNSIARTAIYESTNGGLAVNWASGTKQIVCSPIGEAPRYIEQAQGAALPALTIYDTTKGAGGTIAITTPVGAGPDLTVSGFDRIIFSPSFAVRYAVSNIEWQAGISWALSNQSFFIHYCDRYTLQTNNNNINIFDGGSATDTIVSGYTGLNLQLLTTNVSAASTPAGNVEITAGNATGTGTASNGGNIILTAGSSTNGTAGTIQLKSDIVNSGGTSIINGRATEQLSAASPAAPASTSSYTMQGLAGAITPEVSGKVLLTICGTIIQSAGSGTSGIGIKYQLSYGTGTAPANGAALTGTQAGIVQSYTNPTTVTIADVLVPFSVSAVLTSLTIGTAYWLDLAAEAIATASDVALSNVSITAVEI